MEDNPFSVVKIGRCIGDFIAALKYFNDSFKTLDVGNTTLKRYYLYEDSDIPYMVLAGRIARGEINDNFLFAVASPNLGKCKEVARDFQRITRLVLEDISNSLQLAPRLEIHRQIGDYFIRIKKEEDSKKVFVRN